MASNLVASRNTCFALISAIEEDLRAFIKYAAEAANLNEVLSVDVRENALARWQKDHQSEVGGSVESDYELLPYSDFADLAKILASKIRPILIGDVAWMDVVCRQLNALSPTRNRVCHSRPLETDDLAKTLDFANEVASGPHKDSFPGTRDALELLRKDPSHVLRLQIPAIWATENLKVHHNLPLPEFDDTGFLGRTADRKNVAKLIRSSYPVITIVGEGGIGKTALAQRCLYDLLDDPDNPYEAIVWVSLKGTTLTQWGVQEVSNAITTTIGLLSNIAQGFGAPVASLVSSEQLVAEISEFLREFRVLLAIDNLETLASSELRPLLEAIPPGSKVLFTTRVGIGEFEARCPLGPMDPATCVSLLRGFSRLVGATEIFKADESLLRNYARRLFYNPLLLKWFVSGVSRGGSPANYLNKDGHTFEEALKFCFANLFEKLGENELAIIEALACARQPLTAAELLFIANDQDQGKLEWGLGVLHNSSIVIRTQGQGRSLLYQLSEPVLAYISAQRRPSKEVFARVQARLRELKVLIERERVTQARYKYEIMSVRTGASKDERIAAVFLRRALDRLGLGDIYSARQLVSEAKKLTPLNPEVWRISGIVEGRGDEPFKAMSDYEQAVALDPKSTIARYSLVQYMIRETSDYEAALPHLEAAVALDPNDPTLLGTRALLLVRLGHCREAAIVYEDLLLTIKQRPRKWRITTPDQAAECYRRWAEQDLLNLDVSGAKEHLLRAMEILALAVKNRDWDYDMLDRIGEVIYTSLRNIAVAQRSAEDITNAAEKIAALLDEAIQTRFAKSISECNIPEQIKSRLEAVIRPRASAEEKFGALSSAVLVKPALKNDSSATERYGQVHNVQRSAAFGFLVEPDGQRWFFHRKSLCEPSSWIHMLPGTRVTFRVGANEKGPCAVNVELVG